jgi:hypothetical protein
MAKKPPITTIASGYYSRTALNTNFENLRDQFDNTLSLDGSTPNAMQADLDMNSNDILNAGEVNVNALTIDGVAVFPNNTQLATTYATQNYTGNGSTTTYAMGFNPATKANVDAYIDGVYQNQDAFNISGTNLTFTAAPPLNSAIEIKVPVNLTGLVASDSSQVTYTQGGSGAVTRTVQSRLRDFVSVKDFGAVGDGVTDDTAAIQAAIDACSNNAGTLVFPFGTYVTSTLVPKSNVTIDLQGSTLALKDGTLDKFFAGIGGENFSIINGTLDGNQANNTGATFLSGMSSFTDWSGLVIRNVTFTEIYNATLFLDGTTNNVIIDNVLVVDCGVVNGFSRYAYGIQAYASTKNISIKNYTVSNMYGFGIHFFGCTDFVAENLTFDTLTFGGNAIAITWTQAARGIVQNVYIDGVDGDPLEINASIDQLIENVYVASCGDIPLLFGDNFTGIFNERVRVKNFKAVSTGGTHSVRLNFVKDCSFEQFQTDKEWDTTVSGAPAADFGNKIIDLTIPAVLDPTITEFRKFHVQRASFSNFYIHNFDGAIATISCPKNAAISNQNIISLANGAATYIDFDDIGVLAIGRGFVNGRLRVTSSFNNQQGTYQECLFLCSNNATTLNLSAVTAVNNSSARAVTIAADAANKRISLTNSTGVNLQVTWTVELHMAEN